MRKALVISLAAALVAICCSARNQQPRQPLVRPAAVAGTFYPGDAGELTRMVDGFLAGAAGSKVEGTLLGLISPHAGYPYSGPVAAYGYSLLKGRKIERVIVIAPSHAEAFSYSSVYCGEAYSTPLGRIPVDTGFAARLAALKAARLSTAGHAVSGGRAEHALEVQLPFLQRTLGEFKLVPIVMGDQGYAACRSLANALARLISGGTETLIVASSDLSHYHPYNDAVRLDGNTLRAIQEWDYLSMSRNFDQRVWEACGGAPVITAMMACERLGANQAKLLKYANSGDTAGDKSQVVGYGSLALVRAAPAKDAPTQAFTLGQEEKSELLALAHKSVETVVRQRKLVDLPASALDTLSQERGAFVTLKEKGELRGCIGYVSASKPLAATVRDVAAMAAVRDGRFRPVEPNELGLLEYEISVLSPLRRVLDLKQVEVGRDGLLVKKGDTEGLLLPQVPVEQRWDRMKFIEQTCMKAGLPPDAWKDPQTEFFSFTALVFGDSAHK